MTNGQFTHDDNSYALGPIVDALKAARFGDTITPHHRDEPAAAKSDRVFAMIDHLTIAATGGLPSS